MSFANGDSLMNQGEIVVSNPNNLFGIAYNTLGMYTNVVQSNPVSTAINSIADPTDVEGTWTLRNATNTIVITSQLTIPTGQTLIVPVGSTLRNNHIIFNNGTIINRGTIETYSDGFNVLGDINNDNGRIENNGTIIISRYLINRGSISAPGWFRPRGDVLGGTIENTSTGRINIRPGGRINRCSRFINVGTIDSAGTIMCGLDAIFENNGNGTITNSVNTTGVMENDPTDTLLEHGFVYPGELVLNNINNRTDGTGGINRGTINNKPHCRILLTACRLTNIGTVINTGLLNISTSSLTNNAGSILRNNGTITGQGEGTNLLISTGSTFAPRGTITGLNPTFF
jgi:hypothetical protein